MGLKIKGIRKIHQLSLTSEGIRSEKLSCLECPANKLCNTCKQKKLTFSAERIQNVLTVTEEVGDEQEDDESDEETPFEGYEEDQNDDHQEGDEEEGGDEEDVILSPSDIVWVNFNRRWTAAKIVTLSDIPNISLTRQLKSNSSTTCLVKFYHDETFHRASNSKIELLAQNLVDQSRARHHPTAYLEALSDLSYG